MVYFYTLFCFFFPSFQIPKKKWTSRDMKHEICMPHTKLRKCVKVQGGVKHGQYVQTEKEKDDIT